jgi:hypothetical protein
MRSGYSGFYVFEVMAGAERGKTVTIAYGEDAAPSQVDNWGIANWGIAKVTLQGASPTGLGWPNNCTSAGRTPTTQPISDGSIDVTTFIALPDEKAAHAALAAKCY